ncbi:hypothetical protein Ciccas_005200, partial [Cichlidogyrus casuarinus]
MEILHSYIEEKTVTPISEEMVSDISFDSEGKIKSKVQTRAALQSTVSDVVYVGLTPSPAKVLGATITPDSMLEEVDGGFMIDESKNVNRLVTDQRSSAIAVGDLPATEPDVLKKEEEGEEEVIIPASYNEQIEIDTRETVPDEYWAELTNTISEDLGHDSNVDEDESIQEELIIPGTKENSVEPITEDSALQTASIMEQESIESLGYAPDAQLQIEMPTSKDSSELPSTGSSAETAIYNIHKKTENVIEEASSNIGEEHEDRERFARVIPEEEVAEGAGYASTITNVSGEIFADEGKEESIMNTGEITGVAENLVFEQKVEMQKEIEETATLKIEAEQKKEERATEIKENSAVTEQIEVGEQEKIECSKILVAISDSDISGEFENENGKRKLEDEEFSRIGNDEEIMNEIGIIEVKSAAPIETLEELNREEEFRATERRVENTEKEEGRKNNEVHGRLSITEEVKSIISVASTEQSQVEVLSEDVDAPVEATPEYTDVLKAEVHERLSDTEEMKSITSDAEQAKAEVLSEVVDSLVGATPEYTDVLEAEVHERHSDTEEMKSIPSDASAEQAQVEVLSRDVDAQVEATPDVREAEVHARLSDTKEVKLIPSDAFAEQAQAEVLSEDVDAPVGATPEYTDVLKAEVHERLIDTGEVESIPSD